MDSLRYCRIMRSIAIILLFLIVLDEFYVYIYLLWDVLPMMLEYYAPKDYFTTYSSLVITASRTFARICSLLVLSPRLPNENIFMLLQVFLLFLRYVS